MLRSRLKNIVNKSKELNKPVGSAFEQFKKSLPKEMLIDDDYRLEVAWKFYGSPKDYKHALWEGLIYPIDETDFRLPSIGYNEETDEYEYLNKGKENETVDKDIRVWDNDVIPLVKELKLGGYVRTFNEEKYCWTYTKNSQKETPVDLEGNSIGQEPNLQDVKFLKQGGKKENKQPDELSVKAPKSLPSELVKLIYNSNANFAKRLVDPDRKYLDLGDGNIGSHKLAWSETEYGPIVYPEIQEYNGELIDYSLDRKKALRNALDTHDYIIFPSKEDADWFTADNYKRYFPGLEKYAPQAFKQGGQMSVIPEGALHARKNNMEGAGEDFTAKGIPVVDNSGEQQAEIEREEIIFRKQVTDKMELLYKKYNSEESPSKKDEIAIEMGKIITCEIIKHTDDKTGLIEQILEKI